MDAEKTELLEKVRALAEEANDLGYGDVSSLLSYIWICSQGPLCLEAYRGGCQALYTLITDASQPGASPSLAEILKTQRLVDELKTLVFDNVRVAAHPSFQPRQDE